MKNWEKKLEDVTIERYEFGDYFVDVEEKTITHPLSKEDSLMWDFWLYGRNCGIKSYITGIIAEQKHMNPPRVYTKEDALSMVFPCMYEHITQYREEYETE